MAWCIVKSCCIYFDSGSCRNKECFYFGCVICKIFFDILLMSDQKDKICNRYVDLGIAVIFQSV